MFEFTNLEKGKELIALQDSFIERMSNKECSLKMGVNLIVSKAEYLNHLKTCILSWNVEELQQILKVELEIKKKFKELNIPILESIFIVKTNGNDEWNSAYTRGNAIFLPEKKLHSYDDYGLLKFLLHEYFHIYFRRRKDLQKSLYQIIGFDSIDEIILPDHFNQLKLTNPDAPYINRYIEVKYQNCYVKVIPLVILKEGINNVDKNKDILASIVVKFLVIDGMNCKYLLLNLKDIEGFYEKVGENVPNMLDPDEILAENFVMMILNIDVATPRILKNMKRLLTNQYR